MTTMMAINHVVVDARKGGRQHHLDDSTLDVTHVHGNSVRLKHQDAVVDGVVAVGRRTQIRMLWFPNL